MSKTLYILVGSVRPDVYLNVIAHCVLYQDVTTIELLHIKGLRDKTLQDDRNLAALINHDIHSLIESLAKEATYQRFYDGDGERRVSPEKTDLSHEHTSNQIAAIRTFYENMIRFDYRPEKDVDYRDFSLWLKTKADDNNKTIIDVTAIDKLYLGDIVAAALVEGITNVFTLKLTVREDHQHPWKNLIHNLRDTAGNNNNYAYINILDTEIYRQYRKAVLIRAPHIKVAISVTTVSLIAAGIVAWFTTGDSVEFRVFSSVTGMASLISLVLVYWQPR